MGQARLFRGWRRALAVALALGTAPAAVAAQHSPATVFAAASLTEAFRAIAAAYHDGHPFERVNFNFAGSQQLVLQLTEGAKGDLLATADQQWMREAQARGLIDGDPVPFVRNLLVVIVPRANRAGLHGLEDLARPGVKIVLGDQAVPVGRYSRELLDGLAERGGLGTNYAKQVMGNVVSLEDNVKGVVSKVELGEADAGIVYRSDAQGAAAPALGQIEIPDSLNIAGLYPIALLKGGDNPELGRSFLAYILSPAGQEILERFGFQRLPVGSAATSHPGTKP